MRNNKNDIIVIKDACKDVADLVSTTWFPAYVLRLWDWDKTLGRQRKGINKLTHAIKKPLEMISFILLLGVAGLLINSLKTPDFISYRSPLVVIAIVLAVSGISALIWFPLFDHYEFGLWKAMKLLFDLVPMTAREFPQDEKMLGLFYKELMTDMARLVIDLHAKGDIHNESIAKIQLEALFEGAHGFGFITNPKKGLGPSFAAAYQQQYHQVINADDWMKKFGKKSKMAVGY